MSLAPQSSKVVLIRKPLALVVAQKPIFGSTATAWILPRYRVQDIDDNDDWVRAEAMFSALRHKDRK